MTKRWWLCVWCAMWSVATVAPARTIEDILKEKGFITEDEYKEAKQAEASTKQPSLVGSYRPGKGFQLATPDGNNALTLGGRLQVRYTLTDSAEGADASTFRIRRARLWAEGHLYQPEFRYGFQGDFASTFSLRDAYVEFAHVPVATLKVGQYKVPYNRQQITSSGALQFVDRPVMNEEFLLGDDGRDIGGMLSGEPLKELLAYHLGVFNGSGPNTVNEDTNHMVVGRLLLTPLGAFKDYYSEGDWLGEEKPRLGLGVAAAYSSRERNGRTTRRTGLADPKKYPSFSGADITGATFDAQFKLRGFSALADYYYRNVEPRGAGIEAFAGHAVVAQAGYFVVPQKVEVALRYGWMDPNDAVAHNSVQESGGAVSYLLSGHNLKVQADLRTIDTQRPGRATAHEIEGRVQVQAIF